MDPDQFWTLMEYARAAAEPTIETKDDGEDAGGPIAEELVRQLTFLDTEAVLSFDTHLGQATAALHRWDVWAAAYLINGGCGDDSFIDFKAGVVTLGQDWHRRVIANPDSLADHPAVIAAAAGGDPYVLFAETVNYAGTTALKQITVNKRAYREAVSSTKNQADRINTDMGENFDFDDREEMKRRLPRLAAMFLPRTAP